MTDPLETYRQLMEEAKERMSATAEVVADLRSRRPANGYIGAESCYLQMRMTYEVIALGCAVVHGRLTTIRDEHRAGEIIKRLGAFHADFYPKPVTERITGDTLHLQTIEEAYLTRDRLMACYGRCGEWLHRGTGANLLLGKKRQYDLDDVVEQLNQTHALLQNHYIKVAHGPHWIRVVLDGPEDGKVMILEWFSRA